jgi:hypothetical protein
MHKLKLAAVVVSTLVGITGCTVASAPTGAPIPASSPVDAPTPASTQASTPATSIVPATKIVNLLSVHGNGIKNLKSFTATDDWTLHYTYNCKAFGGSGNFIVTDEGDNFNILANELGKAGKDTTQGSAGLVKLSVNSECSWTLLATQP